MTKNVGWMLLFFFWYQSGQATAVYGEEIHPYSADINRAPSASTAPSLSLDQLAHKSWPELEALYRGAVAGAIPTGYARGLTLYCPNSRFVGIRSGVTKVIWKGKIFDCSGQTLVNQWCGIRAIRAAVCYGPSWLDGEQSIIMDYSETSRVWSDVRDEIREVAPGLYLGRMYRRKECGPQFKLFFALEICPFAAKVR